MAEDFGSQPSPIKDPESSTYTQYTPECVNQSLFPSFISPESPEGTNQAINIFTGQPFGELDLSGSELFKRRVFTKPNIVGECGQHDESTSRLENGTDQANQRNKRVRTSPPEAHKKTKKIKVDSKDDQENEGQSGFSLLSEFLNNIQQLNDGNLSFELDVSYSAFKLKLNYSFE